MFPTVAHDRTMELSERHGHFANIYFITSRILQSSTHLAKSLLNFECLSISYCTLLWRNFQLLFISQRWVQFCIFRIVAFWKFVVVCTSESWEDSTKTAHWAGEWMSFSENRHDLLHSYSSSLSQNSQAIQMNNKIFQFKLVLLGGSLFFKFQLLIFLHLIIFILQKVLWANQV